MTVPKTKRTAVTAKALPFTAWASLYRLPKYLTKRLLPAPNYLRFQQKKNGVKRSL